MNIKELAVSRYQVVAIMDGDECPAEDFLLDGEDATHSYRVGLVEMLEKVAQDGLQNVPSKWFHEANKQQHIYEFIKGPLRLFFFKGVNSQIAVCTSGVRKGSPKADPASVAKAARYRSDYFKAVQDNTLQVVSDEAE